MMDANVLMVMGEMATYVFMFLQMLSKDTKH